MLKLPSGTKTPLQTYAAKLQQIETVSNSRFKWLMINDDNNFIAVGLFRKLVETIKGWTGKTNHTSQSYIEEKIQKFVTDGIKGDSPYIDVRGQQLIDKICQQMKIHLGEDLQTQLKVHIEGLAKKVDSAAHPILPVEKVVPKIENPPTPQPIIENHTVEALSIQLPEAPQQPIVKVETPAESPIEITTAPAPVATPETAPIVAEPSTDSSEETTSVQEQEQEAIEDNPPLITALDEENTIPPAVDEPVNRESIEPPLTKPEIEEITTLEIEPQPKVKPKPILKEKPSKITAGKILLLLMTVGGGAAVGLYKLAQGGAGDTPTGSAVDQFSRPPLPNLPEHLQPISNLHEHQIKPIEIEREDIAPTITLEAEVEREHVDEIHVGEVESLDIAKELSPAKTLSIQIPNLGVSIPDKDIALKSLEKHCYIEGTGKINPNADTDSLYLLGLLKYEQNAGKRENPGNLFFTTAGEKGHAGAIFMQAVEMLRVTFASGSIYYHSIELLRKASAKGHIPSKILLRDLLRSNNYAPPPGLGTKDLPPLEEARNLTHEIFEHMKSRSHSSVVSSALRDGTSETLSATEKAANDLDADARYRMGLYYMNAYSPSYDIAKGEVVLHTEHDLGEARQWFLKALRLGHIDAIYALSKFESESIKQKHYLDIVISASMIPGAQYHHQAAFDYALLLQKEQESFDAAEFNVNENLQKTVDLFKKAGEKIPQALFEAAKIYKDRLNDMSEYRRLMKEAAVKGYANAYEEAGSITMSEGHPSEATGWYIKAIEAGKGDEAYTKFYEGEFVFNEETLKGNPKFVDLLKRHATLEKYYQAMQIAISGNRNQAITLLNTVKDLLGDMAVKKIERLKAGQDW